MILAIWHVLISTLGIRRVQHVLGVASLLRSFVSQRCRVSSLRYMLLREDARPLYSVVLAVLLSGAVPVRGDLGVTALDRNGPHLRLQPGCIPKFPVRTALGRGPDAAAACHLGPSVAMLVLRLLWRRKQHSYLFLRHHSFRCQRSRD